MATAYGSVVADAILAESLTEPQGADVYAAMDVDGLLTGLVAWLNDPDNQGKDETEWRAAFPQLSALSDAQTRAVMRVVVEITGGTFLP